VTVLTAFKPRTNFFFLFLGHVIRLATSQLRIVYKFPNDFIESLKNHVTKIFRHLSLLWVTRPILSFLIHEFSFVDQMSGHVMVT